jgi:hypothetical protein
LTKDLGWRCTSQTPRPRVRDVHKYVHYGGIELSLENKESRQGYQFLNMETPDVKPLPPPFIYVPTLANLRDVGGLPVQQTTKSSTPLVVRKKIIYRSADPSFLAEEDIKFIREELGITHIYDLRSEPEFEKQGDALQEWVARIETYNKTNPNKVRKAKMFSVPWV